MSMYNRGCEINVLFTVYGCKRRLHAIEYRLLENVVVFLVGNPQSSVTYECTA